MSASGRSLANDHMTLVRAIAAKVKRQLTPNVELDDLVAYGMEGALEAADRFDESKGVTFVTFAYHRIRGAIYDGLREMGHLPRSEYAKVKAAQKANAYLQNLQEREVGAATAPGGPPPAPTPEDDLRAMYEAMAGVVTCFVTSMDALLDEGQDFVEEVLDPEERAVVAQAGDRVKAAISRLPDKERHFIEAHYFGDKTLLDAGKELGLSKSWASRLHARAIELLRKELESE